MANEITQIKVGTVNYDVRDDNSIHGEIVSSIPSTLTEDDLTKLYRINTGSSIDTYYAINQISRAAGTTCNMTCTVHGKQLSTTSIYNYMESNYSSVMGVNVTCYETTNVFTAYYNVGGTAVQALRVGTRNPGNLTFSRVASGDIIVIAGQYYSYDASTGTKTYDSNAKMTVNGETYTLNEEPTEYIVNVSSSALLQITTNGSSVDGRAFIYGFKTTGSASTYYGAVQLADSGYVQNAILPKANKGVSTTASGDHTHSVSSTTTSITYGNAATTGSTGSTTTADTSNTGAHTHSVDSHTHGSNVSAATSFGTTDINNYSMSYSSGVLTITSNTVVKAYTSASYTSVAATPSSATLTAISAGGHSHTYVNLPAHTHSIATTTKTIVTAVGNADSAGAHTHVQN